MLELDWETYIIGRGTGRRRKLEISSKGRKRTRASCQCCSISCRSLSALVCPTLAGEMSQCHNSIPLSEIFVTCCQVSFVKSGPITRCSLSMSNRSKYCILISLANIQLIGPPSCLPSFIQKAKYEKTLKKIAAFSTFKIETIKIQLISPCIL